MHLRASAQGQAIQFWERMNTDIFLACSAFIPQVLGLLLARDRFCPIKDWLY